MPLDNYIKRLQDKYHEIGIRLVSDDIDTAVVELDISSIFRKFKEPVRLLLVNSENYEKVMPIVDDYLIENSQNSDLFPILFTPTRKLKDIYQSIRRLNFFVDSQPIINVESFLQSGTPKEIIRSVLLSYSSSNLLSPYRIDDYAYMSMFFGREKMLKELIRTPGNHIVSGPRRIGKTSLVKRLQHQLGSLKHIYEGVKKTNNQIRKCSFVDVSGLGSENVKTTIWRAILEQFNLDYKSINILGRQVTKSERSTNNFDDFKALQKFISQYSYKTTIILDEVDHWLVNEAATKWESLDRLRSITDGGKANLILVGYESFLTATTNPNFPLKARGEMFFLGPLDKNSIRDLIVLPMKELNIRLDPENDIVERIWQETSGLPHLTQGICRHLVDVAFGKGKREYKSDGKRTKEITITPLDLTAAINLTGVLKEYREDISHWDFPLAEAIAGILCFSSRLSSHGVGLSNNGILTELEKNYGYAYNRKEFELAIKHLELRFIIKSLDSTRTSWEWTNQTTRRIMEIKIDKLGVDRWRKDLVRRHEEGEWKSSYKILTTGIK